MILTDGSHPVTLPPPKFGYQSAVVMPISYSERKDRTYGTVDATSTYDRRFCSGLSFDLDETEQRDLVDLILDASKGRGKDLQLQLGSDATGFFPFAPDLGDKNTFVVRATLRQDSSMNMDPFRHFTPLIDLRYISGPDVAYTWSDNISDGDITIGRIGGVGYPQDGFKVDTFDSVIDIYTQNASAFEVDGGESGDSYDMNAVFYARYSKMASLVDHFVNVVRGDNLTFNLPEYSYPYGRRKSESGNFTSTPLYSEIDSSSDSVSIVMTHTQHNYFESQLRFRFVS